MTALDAIGPHEVLSRLPGAKVFRVAAKKGPILTDSAHLILTADYALADVTKADVVLVPGAGSATPLLDQPDTLAWLRAIHATTTWTTSVCTGSLILAAAGLLSNVKATTHWAAMDRLKLWHAIPTEARVVQDGKIMTSAGVSAGIDMALLLSSKIAGEKFAQAIQLGIEYDPDPPFDVGSPKKADPAIREALRSRMTAHFVKVPHELSS
jgi:transcriptional regulator GlxA family with amidase domain